MSDADIITMMHELQRIISRDNRRVVAARQVRGGKVSDRIFIEGRRLAEEALKSQLSIHECFIVEGFDDSDLLSRALSQTSDAAKVPEKIFNSIADTRQPQGIILIAERPQNSLGSLQSRVTGAALPMVLYLSEINNPSNLGAVLRTAEAVDIAGVIVSQGSADVFSPKAIRAAMGASFRLPVVEDVIFDDVLQWARSSKMLLTASVASGSLSYRKVDWRKPRLLIIGSEAHGLTADQLAVVDETIRIPMQNAVESLNLAVSAGVLMFEAARQNGLE